MMQKLYMSSCSENMPWIEISEGMTSEMAEALCADLPCSSGQNPASPLCTSFSENLTRGFFSDSKVMKKWELCNKYGGTSIAEWLCHDAVVDNVKFNGK
jgi:hypothetical protein